MIITITNNRGGTGKSTTAQTLATGLSQVNKRVLLLDLDPQANTTATLGLIDNDKNIYTALTGQCNIREAIYNNGLFDIIGSVWQLGANEDTFKQGEYFYKMHKLVKEQLDQIKADYDFIIIDTAPNLSLITTNALYTSDLVIIPMLADIYSMQGLNIINKQIQDIRKGTDNKGLKIAGLLLTHYKANTIINQDLKDNIKAMAEQLGTKLYKDTIRESVIFSEAQALKSNVLIKYPSHKATADYRGFIKEFMKDTK